MLKRVLLSVLALLLCLAVANLGELVRFYHQLLRNLDAPAP